MTTPTSPAQEEAYRQVQKLKLGVFEYESMFWRSVPRQTISGLHLPGDVIRRGDLWNVSHETISGDFDVDDVLAKELATRLVSYIVDGDWLKDYLMGQPGKNAGFGEHLSSATIGPGNLLGTADGVRRAAETGLASRSIGEASKKIITGKAQSVRINNHMTLYNANQSGKGSPRMRMRITGLPAKVVSPAVSLNDLRMYRNGNFSVRGRDVKSMTGVAALTSKTRILNIKGVGGVLTFAPTAAIDLYASINRDKTGNLRWDHRQFFTNEAKNQSGNLAGYGATLAVEVIVVVGFGAAAAASAPVIICGLLAGVVAQVIWNKAGMSDKVGSYAERAIGR